MVKELCSQRNYIRFELGLEELRGKDYQRECLRRANVIYRSIFEPEDRVIFIHRTSYTRDEREKSIPRLKRFFRTRLQQMQRRILPYEFDESDDEFYTIEWAVEAKAVEIRQSYVLECIANSDFNRKPTSDGRIYLYNQEKNILLHMYDDRGCDVYSSEIETLLPLFHLHRQWILDYNRYQIDNLFGEGLAGIFETDEEQMLRVELNDQLVAESRINLSRTNTCHISHHFEIPIENADRFEQEISFASFSLRRSSTTNNHVSFVAVKTQALALIGYQTHLMSMYGKKYGRYIGWTYEQAF
ncbi:DUF3885 domain-containing protein [Paenibacillus sp. CCS19]|uniref:DUF3885 domain-containing protein n=1 Tax=Paenibacillus sp. CCS19 TaxID=3158387 RepID=UPI00295F2B12|nr:DUF3885 domain-containing protein [Paenibacillus cellulosilyticus]